MSFHKNHTCFEQQYPIPLSVLHTCIPLSVLHTCFEQQYPIPLSVIIIFVHVLISNLFLYHVNDSFYHYFYYHVLMLSWLSIFILSWSVCLCCVHKIIMVFMDMHL